MQRCPLCGLYLARVWELQDHFLMPGKCRTEKMLLDMGWVQIERDGYQVWRNKKDRRANPSDWAEGPFA